MNCARSVHLILTLNLCVQWHVLRNTTYNILQGCRDILFRRTLESLGNRAHRVRGHGAPRRVLRRRFHDLGKATEAQGLLKNALVIGVDLMEAYDGGALEEHVFSHAGRCVV
jgi:hypothetical protein